MFLPIFGGILADKIGNSTCNILFSLLIASGQAVFAFGVSIQSYPIALLGRGIFGLGGESLNVSQINTVVEWFSKKEQSMAVSVIFMVRRLSTAINDNTTPDTVENTSLAFGLWVGFFLCVLSLIMALIIRIITKRKNKLLGSDDENGVPLEEKFNLRDMKEFGTSFWLTALYCALMEASVYAFNSVASDYFQKRFGYSSVEGGRIISITFLLCGLFCPITGVLLDRYGKRIYYIIGSAVSILLAHFLFLMTPDSNKPIGPIIYMVPLGIGFSVASTVTWSSISYLVGKGSGTALGITMAMVDTALAIFPIFVGYINENTKKEHGYYWVSVLFVCISSVGLLNSIILFFQNIKDGTLHTGKHIEPS